jgi:hypothetical protein
MYYDILFLSGDLMAYNNFSRDTPDSQLIDFTQLIFRNIAAIQECTFYKMYDRIPQLVEELENLLYAYRDTEYIEEIKAIDKQCDISITKKHSTESIDRIVMNANNRKTQLKYRALMSLAFRKNFTPAKGGSKTMEV